MPRGWGMTPKCLAAGDLDAYALVSCTQGLRFLLQPSHYVSAYSRSLALAGFHLQPTDLGLSAYSLLCTQG